MLFCHQTHKILIRCLSIDNSAMGVSTKVRINIDLSTFYYKLQSGCNFNFKLILIYVVINIATLQ